MSVIREGLVVRCLEGSARTDSEARRAIERICRRSGLSGRQWHTLRRRDIPEVVLAAGTGEHDPDCRIVKLLGARASHVRAASAPTIESEAIVAS